MGWPYQQKPPSGWPLDYSSGLVPDAGFWLFNEGSGGQVFDLSGNSLNGTLGSSAIWTPAKFGSGILHNSMANGEVLLTYKNLGTKCTYVFWICPTAAPGNPYVFSYMSSVIRFIGATGYRFYPTGTGYLTSGTVALQVGVWSQVAVTHDGSKGTCYFDGKISSGPTTLVALDTTNTHNAVGGRGLADGFVGKSDHCLIYDRDLTASEIALLYREPFCMFKDPAEVALLGGYQLVGEAGIMTPNTGFWGPTF